MSLTPADLAGGSTPLGATEYNTMLAAARAGVYFEHDLGGDSETGHPGVATTTIMKSKPFVIPGANELAGTWKFAAFLRCEDNSVTITVSLYDLTLGAVVAGSTSAACNGTTADYSTSNQVPVSGALTLVAGHIYVAQAVKSANTKQCWVDAAYLRRTDA